MARLAQAAGGLGPAEHLFDALADAGAATAVGEARTGLRSLEPAAVAAFCAERERQAGRNGRVAETIMVALAQIGAHANRIGEALAKCEELTDQMADRLKEPARVVLAPAPPSRRLPWLPAGLALGIVGAIALRAFGH